MHIEFTEGEDKITLEGPTEDVNVAREQIEAMVKDLVRRPPLPALQAPAKWQADLTSLAGTGGPSLLRGAGSAGGGRKLPGPREAWAEGSWLEEKSVRGSRGRARSRSRSRGVAEGSLPPLAPGRVPCLTGRHPRGRRGPSPRTLLPPQSNRMDYVEINIDHKFHRHLIGKSGANSECGRRAAGGRLLTGTLASPGARRPGASHSA